MVFEILKVFIVPLEEYSAGLSDVSFPAIGTRESVNITSAEFRDLVPVIYAKIFS